MEETRPEFAPVADKIWSVRFRTEGRGTTKKPFGRRVDIVAPTRRAAIKKFLELHDPTHIYAGHDVVASLMRDETR